MADDRYDPDARSESALFESGVRASLARQANEKEALARAAAEHIESGQARIDTTQPQPSAAPSPAEPDGMVAGDEADPGPHDDDRLRPRDRRARIVDLVTERGPVRIEDLAREFGVSIMTVHRDLDNLSDQQLLRKVRGAATVLPSALFESGVRARLARQAHEKEALARAAAEHVESGQAVMLDDSTTGVFLARLLPSRAPLTVITNFLTVMRELSGKPGIRLIGLGGTYYEWADAFMGGMTIDAIRSLRVDLVVMSTSAVTDGVCHHQSQETVTFKRAMLEVAASRILYVDHAKFSRRALHMLAPLTAFDLVIVDDRTPRETIEQMRSRGIALEVVPT